VRRKQSTKLSVLIFFILLTIVGCGGQENEAYQGSDSPQQETDQVIAEETDLQQTDQVVAEETTEQIPQIFIQMLENHPLHRSGVLSPDNRYYAYEERSSIILVRLPTAEEYRADKILLPKVLFVDGRRKESSFAEIEADYARRLKQPLLTEEELNEARNKLRSVYDWNAYYYLKYSQDGRYLAYLGESNFGSDRTCTVYVLDLEDNCKLYTLPVEENSEYAEINWQANNQTLELYLPWAEKVDGGYLAVRRYWHIPSGQINLTYYNTEGGQEVVLADALTAIEEHDRAEAEHDRAAEEIAQLTVEQRVAALTPEELAEEYARYFSLHAEQIRMLQERGYSNEAIAKMDSLDFQQEEEGWLLSEESIRHVKNLYPELKDEDLSQWTHKDFMDYDRPLTDARNAPPETLKQEMLERGLPNDIPWRVAKEFHGWDNMLSYTDEAIMAMYEAVQQTDAIFGKEEAYRLAVRAAYLGIVPEPPEDEKISVRYWLGDGGEKTINYSIKTIKEGEKALLNAKGDIILSGFEEYDLMLKLILARKDSKWGLYNQRGEKIIEHIFDDILNPEMPDGYKVNGLVRVKKNGLWGAIDQDGNIVIQPEFDFIHLTYYEEIEPFIKVEKNGKFGYLTRDGKPLVDTIWDAAFMDVLNVPEDIIFVKQGNKWGGIRVKGYKAAPVDWNLIPSEEAQLSFNNWKYAYQHDFYIHQIRDGKTYISATTIIFFNDYFRRNSSKIRSLPEFSFGHSPNWDELTKFIYENTAHNPSDLSITKENFAETVKKYFGNITYTHQSSTYLEYKDEKYTPKGWNDHGFFIYELTELEKVRTEDGKDSWKARITGYYFYELDGDPNESPSIQSKNAQAVWEEMKKEEYKGLNFWQACDRLVWNNPGAVLAPACEWVIQFAVNDPLGDMYFTYLACEKKDY